MSSVTDALTSIQNNTVQANAEKAKTTAGNSTLSQDSFLQLMMAQLKYQDPLNPTDNSQLLSQQAALTQVSELQKLNQNNYFVQASNLIGKNVAFADPDNSDQTIIGTVAQTSVDSSGVTLTITGVTQDADGNIITDSNGNEIVSTASYTLSQVMSDNGSVTLANPTSTSSSSTSSTSSN